MTTAIPPVLKPITAFINRADELDRDSSNPDNRVVAYYCRTEAVSRALKIKETAPRNQEMNAYIIGLMDKLQECKGTLNVTREQAKVICEEFAMSLFVAADDYDRMANCEELYKKAGKLFYTLGTYFDILDQFDDVNPEVPNMRKHCKWRAMELMKAVKEGREPAPAGYEFVGGDGVEDGDGLDDSAMPAMPPPPVASQPTYPVYVPPAAPSSQDQLYNNYGYNVPAISAPVTFPSPVPTPSTPVPRVSPGAADDIEVDVMELCTNAIAALKHHERDIARAKLQSALARLQ